MASPYDIIPGKIFLGGISAATTQETVYEYFSSFGELDDCVVMQDRATGKSRGFGFVTYKDPLITSIVLSQTHVIDGRVIDCKRAVPRDQKNEINREESSIRVKKLFVGGLSLNTTQETFKEYFEQFGKLEDWVIMVDKATGKPRGFGFVTFESEDSAELVISKYYENKIDGKWIEVKKALPREARSGSVSQTSTANPSPSVSATSSKKNSLNSNESENDLDIVRSILMSQSTKYQGQKGDVDNSDLKGSDQLHQNGQNIGQVSDKGSFWEKLIRSEENEGIWSKPHCVRESNQQMPYYYQQQGFSDFRYPGDQEAGFPLNSANTKYQGINSNMDPDMNSRGGGFNTLIQPFDMKSHHNYEKNPSNFQNSGVRISTAAWQESLNPGVFPSHLQSNPLFLASAPSSTQLTTQALPVKKTEKYIPLY